MKKTAQKILLLPVLLSCLLLACSREEVPGPQIPDGPGPVGNSNVQIVEDEVAGVPLVIMGSQGLNFAVAYQRTLHGELRSFTAVQGQLPIVAEDELGNRWDVFGRAVSGPDQGEQLEYINAGIGFWFVFGAMYPGVEIHGMGGREVRLTQDTLDGWDIPTGVVAQGTGFDGITTLNEPDFFTYNVLEVDPELGFFLDDSDLVIAVSVAGETKVYPHAMLDWHEVVNDDVGGVPISVTYCPLTGTAKVWRRQGSGVSSYYGISGLLYNSNVLTFDRSTESFWHQLEARAVHGDRMGEELELIPHIETSWGSWKRFESNPLVLSPDTATGRDYDTYPYGDYRSSEIISYPIAFDDDRLGRKERVFCVLVNGTAKVYRLADF